MWTHNLNNITGHQEELMLEWFLHHMTMEQRGKLMAEMPMAYLAVMDSRVSTLDAVIRKVEEAANERGLIRQTGKDGR